MIYIQNLIFKGLLCLLILNILSIIIDIFKRAKIKKKSVIIALRDINFNLIQSTFYFTALIISFIIFLKWYFIAYSILIPNYLNKWYQLLDYNSLLMIKDIFLQNNRLLELLRITTFMKLEFQGFSMIMVFLIIGISHLYKGLQRKTISNEGVYCLGKILNWDEIMEYEWHCPISKNNIKKDSEYYKLSLYTKIDKFGRWLLYQNTVKYTLKISSIDKEKVDYLINSNNLKMKKY